jgi:hypothetical protein
MPVLGMACGHCLEDRVASVYDHALVEQAKQHRQTMMYLTWDGPVGRDENTRKLLLAQAARVPGVVLGSVRVALEPATIGLAFNPTQTNRDAVEAALRQRLVKSHISASSLPDLPIHPVERAVFH